MPDIRVQDEQGNIHVFPDGSTPDMIAQAMHVKPPTQEAKPLYQRLAPSPEAVAQQEAMSLPKPEFVGSAPERFLQTAVPAAGEMAKGVGKVLALGALAPAYIAKSQIDQIYADRKNPPSRDEQLGRLAGVSGDALGQEIQSGNYAGAAGEIAPAIVTALVGARKVGPVAGKVAGEVANQTKRAFSKGAVTKNMGSEISSALDRVATQAGLPASKEASLSAKTAEIVGGLKKQAQAIYSDLDKASGGRYQRFRNEIDEITDAMQNKYTPPESMPRLKEKLAQVENDYAKIQQELIAQNVDPATIKAADAKWAQMKALEQVGKKFKVGETLSGELKPGTPAIDTGMKNLKPHILPQATKGEAAGIKQSVMKATKQVAKVKTNQRIAKGTAVALGITGGTAYGFHKLRDALSGE